MSYLYGVTIVILAKEIPNTLEYELLHFKAFKFVFLYWLEIHNV